MNQVNCSYIRFIRGK